MTLSSSMRCSSKRDFRLQNHKRGHSFDSGLTIKLKEDDLVLFSDMQMRESENFLLNSSDDFDDSLGNYPVHLFFLNGISLLFQTKAFSLRYWYVSLMYQLN